MDIGGWFTAHPKTMGETYAEHLGMATSFGWRMVVAGTACMLHGVLPFLFVGTGSRAVSELHQRMIVGRSARALPLTLRVNLLNSQARSSDFLSGEPTEVPAHDHSSLSAP
jgi:hypothetical protein